MASSPFRIGLVMAGGTSAGAYTAGVLDFLIEALDAWEAEKAKLRAAGVPKDQWTVPPHDVRIEVVTGASAGGVCGAILATLLGRPHAPMGGRDIQPKGANKLYDTWVHGPDIARLLATGDIDRSPKLRSVLNAEPLEEIAAEAIRMTGPWSPCAYAADGMQVILTTGNLRGIAYRVPFAQEAPGGHDMVLHADSVRFYWGRTRNASLEAEGLDQLDPALPGAPSWDRLKGAALATSAFPVGLAARRIEARSAAYLQRKWDVPWAPVAAPKPDPEIDYGVWYARHPVEPLSPQPGSVTYAYVAVDGGIANNEPFDIAHRVLARGGRNPRAGDTADAAILMVDPFPSPYADRKIAEDDDLISVLGQIVGLFLDQARFKPEDLALAQREDVFSRFMIAPVRRPGPGLPPYPNPLASGSLASFGGFLDVSWRHHDFLLGRLNCRKFLEDCFQLYDDNPLFADWSRDAAHPVNAAYTVPSTDPSAPGGVRRFRSVIPVVAEVPSRPVVPLWPRIPPSERAEFVERVTAQAVARADAVVGKLRGQLLAGFGGWAAGVAWRLKGRGAFRAKVRNTIEKELVDYGL